MAIWAKRLSGYLPLGQTFPSSLRGTVHSDSNGRHIWHSYKREGKDLEAKHTNGEWSKGKIDDLTSNGPTRAVSLAANKVLSAFERIVKPEKCDWGIVDRQEIKL